MRSGLQAIAEYLAQYLTHKEVYPIHSLMFVLLTVSNLSVSHNRWSQHLLRAAQHVCPHHHVHVLPAGRPGTQGSEVPLVEEVPYLITNGQLGTIFLCSLRGFVSGQAPTLRKSFDKFSKSRNRTQASNKLLFTITLNIALNTIQDGNRYTSLSYVIMLTCKHLKVITVIFLLNLIPAQ